MATPLYQVLRIGGPCCCERLSRVRRSSRTKLGRFRAALVTSLSSLALVGAVVAAPSVALAQDDELTSANAWAIDQVQARGAWETTKGEGATVAVVDSGIGEHPFFEDKDVLRGHSTLNSDEEDAWHDRQGHGTHVAAGVLYVAPEATVLPVRSSNGMDIGEFGGGDTVQDHDAIRWAADNGADIIVTAWGVHDVEPDAEILEAVQYAIDKDVVVVAAAGNEAGANVAYPASIPGVVAVTGTNREGGFLATSTKGPEVVVAAPADQMLHPVPDNGNGLDANPDLYEENGGGTSLGSGITGGVAALIASAHPDLDASNIIQRLIMTAGDGNGTRSGAVGYGLVNADAAVHAEGIESVEENPLGYPMGEAGASGAGTDDEASSEGGDTDGAVDEPEVTEAGGTAAGESDSGLSTIIVVTAAIVLVGAAIAVWLVLRGRGRRLATPGGSGPASPFVPEPGPSQNGFQQAPVAQQQFTSLNPEAYSPPPTGGRQSYGSPPSGHEPSPPSGPSDPNSRG
ncbi:S8 family serine peptidase [Glycomyces halotolerans]